MLTRNRVAHTSFFHKFLALAAVLVISASVVVVAIITRAEVLEDGVEVEKDTELTYYLHVKYDGVDVSGVESSDQVTAEVLSDRIKVTDVLPKGLTFKGFVTSSNGTFGAVSRADSSVACAGHVLDDTKEEIVNQGTWNGTEFYYHGLHYDSTTRQVSFYVERLKAGCVLDIGIITQTPATVDDPETTEVEIRRDFYNTAYAKEGDITARSNTVHVWMGSLVANEHQVTYTYTGTVPTGAPAVPAPATYAKDASVSVEQEPHLDGYTFSGWTTSSQGVTVTNGLFEMPDNDVIFVGNWVVDTSPVVDYQVHYTVYGATQADEPPSWAVAPKTRRYEAGAEVATDSTEEGMFDGYHFSGWLWEDPTTHEEVPVGTGFVMPAANVEIWGYYERVSYTVTYLFEGSIIPPGADALLPETLSYYPGDTVTTAPYPTAPAGYRFLGWYKSETFKMPEENVVIYGEWGIQNGSFAPTIAKEVVGDQQSYIFGDTVQFKITLCNTASYEIHDVILQEQLEGTAFQNGATSNLANVELETTLPADSILKINSIPANSCAITYASYVVRTGEEETITNTVEMIGALADDYNLLDTTRDYTASDTFDVDAYTEPDPQTGVAIKNTFVFIGLVIITVIGGSVVILNRKRA